MLETIYSLYKVAPQVKLSERDQPIEVFYGCDKVVGKIQHSQLRQVIDILNLGDLVRMKVKHIELIQILQVPYPLNHILAKHEHSQGGHCMQMGDLFDLVVVEVEKDKAGQGD